MFTLILIVAIWLAAGLLIAVSFGALAGGLDLRTRDEIALDDEEEDTSDWPDDHYVDSPQRGQAREINRKGIW